MWSAAAYETAGDGTHGAQLEKLLVLAFDIITVIVGECEGQAAVCFWGAMLCKTWMVSQLHTWQNILSLSTEGLLYRGLPVVLRECEKHLSVCCGLTTSSHPIMDLG